MVHYSERYASTGDKRPATATVPDFRIVRVILLLIYSCIPRKPRPQSAIDQCTELHLYTVILTVHRPPALYKLKLYHPRYTVILYRHVHIKSQETALCRVHCRARRTRPPPLFVVKIRKQSTTYHRLYFASTCADECVPSMA
jgi:hypothetical protein